MQIQSGKNNKPSPQVKKSPNGDDSRKENIESDLSIQDIVTKGAYAAGGAMGGVGLGVVTGNVMSGLTGVPLFSQVGGVAGAVAGAGTALVASNSDDKAKTLKNVFLGWTLGSAAAAGGQWVAGNVLQAASAAGAAPWLGVAGPLIGTVAGGLTGASAPHWGKKEDAKLLKSAAAVGLGATAGVGIGAGLQVIVAHNAPHLAHMTAVAPVIGAASLGAVAYSWKDNAGYNNYNRKSEEIGTAGALSGVGYLVGTGIGAAAQAFGGNMAYTVAMPVAGLAVGLLGSYSASEEDLPRKELAGKAAFVTAGTGAATLVGDAIGHGLTALTGHAIYSQVGAAVGGANGAIGTLAGVGLDTKKVAPTVFGASSGTVAGALLGSALTAFSGQEVWKVALPALGAAAGGLSALAVSFQADQKGDQDKKG